MALKNLEIVKAQKRAAILEQESALNNSNLVIAWDKTAILEQ